MQFIKNLRLPIKLYTSAALIIGLIAIMAFSSWSAFHKVEGAFHSMRRATELSNLAQTAQAKMAGAAYANLAVSKAQSEADIEQFAKISADQRAQAEATLKTALASSPDAAARDLLQTMLTKSQEYDKLSQQGMELRRAYIARQKELFELSPKLADAMAYAVDQAATSAPALTGSMLSASRGLVAARTYMLRFLLSNSDADAKNQQQALQTAQAAVQMANMAAVGTPVEEIIDSVTQMSNTYESSASLLMALAMRSNKLWYTQARAVRQEMNDTTQRTVEHLLSAGRRDSAAAVESLTQASSVLAGVAALVLAVVVLINWLTVHLIARPIVAVTSVMNRLAEGDNTVEVSYRDQTDEVGGMAQAVQVFKENALRLERMNAEQDELKARAEAEKKRAMEDLADALESSVKGIAETVSAAATQMHHTAEALTSISQETSSQATSVAAATEQASNNVETVASAAEELTSSIQEIGRQVTAASDIAASAVRQTERTNGLVVDLAQAAARIGEVIGLITDIANQTNLLALNATIEAARAGEMGKGFAVVAGEVKNLANQTARATEDISTQIGGVQTSTQEAVSAIQTISSTIDEISGIQGTIAAAVEEQTAATNEIARNVEQAAAGTRDVSSHIEKVTAAAGRTGEGAGELLAAAEELARQSVRLDSEVDDFIARIRAA